MKELSSQSYEVPKCIYYDGEHWHTKKILESSDTQFKTALVTCIYAPKIGDTEQRLNVVKMRRVK